MGEGKGGNPQSLSIEGADRMREDDRGKGRGRKHVTGGHVEWKGFSSRLRSARRELRDRWTQSKPKKRVENGDW